MPTDRPTQHLGTPLRPRQGKWTLGSGDLTATWFCYDPRGVIGLVYARPYHDRRGRIRWQMYPRIPPRRLPSADEIRAAHRVQERLQEQARRKRELLRAS